MAVLETRSWFTASPPSVQETLRGLSRNSKGMGDCSGYLSDLAGRPDEIGGVKHLYIHSVSFGEVYPIFGILTVFRVLKGDESYYYQYFSWKQGPTSGTKGILLVRTEGKITHLVIMKVESFALGKPFYDCPGGFMEVGDQKTVDLASGLVNRMKTEVAEEVGIQLTSEQMKIHNLGRIQTDPGMTNNHPALFAIEIDASVAGDIKEGERVNPDVYELNSGPVIVSIDRLWGPNGLIETNDCSYFHILITRLLSRGFIPGPG